MFFRFILFAFCFLSLEYNSHAFFQYLNKKNTPLFVGGKKGMWYIGPGAGITMFATQNFGGYFQNQTIDSILESPSRLKYSPYFVAVIGYKPFDYNFRFELNFDYMNSISTTSSFDTFYEVNGVYLKTMSVSMQRFRIGGSIIYQIDTPITISAKPIGVFFGIGAGFSMNKAFLHNVSSYTTADTTSSLTTNNISQFSPPTSGSSIITKGPVMIAAYFDFSVGMTIDFSETVLAQIKAVYSITTKPFLNQNLTAGVNKFYGNMMKNQLVGIEMSILFRTN